MAEAWPFFLLNSPAFDMELAPTEPSGLEKGTRNDISGQRSASAHNTLVDPPSDCPPSPQSRDPPEIEWLYLAFDTPIPTNPVLPPSCKTELPPCPDLNKYINPFDWSLNRKRLVTYLACLVNIIAAWASGAYASPEAQLTQKWHVSHVVYNTGITIFTAGFGIAPMILAPLSEINGRRPVFIASGLLFVICSLTCGLTDSFAGMLLSRFFLGIGGSSFSTMSGGILADIWKTDERNTAMTLFAGATLLGTGMGPLVSGIVAEKLLWRWVFYIQVFTSGFVIALIIFLFRETRGSIVLSSKAKALNKFYDALESAGAIGVVYPPDLPLSSSEDKPSTTLSAPIPLRIRYKVLADEQRSSLLTLLSLSIYRPFHLLVTEPVVFFFSLWISFAWAVLYLQFSSIPLVFSTNHNFTLAQTGYVFTAMCVGGILSAVLGITQDKWAVKHYPHKFQNPEGRLLFTCLESAFVPIGLFFFGWTCQPSMPWILPTIAVAVSTIGICSVFLAVFNYSADVYHTYASSALAASGLCRNLLAGSFPLVTHALFNNLGFQEASSLLGAIGAVLTLVPWVLVKWGPEIRRRSRIASAFVEGEGGG